MSSFSGVAGLGSRLLPHPHVAQSANACLHHHLNVLIRAVEKGYRIQDGVGSGDQQPPSS
jgi:hypothetical protein